MYIYQLSTLNHRAAAAVNIFLYISFNRTLSWDNPREMTTNFEVRADNGQKTRSISTYRLTVFAASIAHRDKEESERMLRSELALLPQQVDSDRTNFSDLWLENSNNQQWFLQ